MSQAEGAARGKAQSYIELGAFKELKDSLSQINKSFCLFVFKGEGWRLGGSIGASDS